MDTYPKIGMTYKQSLKRGVRFVKEGNSGLAGSITNQVRLHEGEKAAREFAREIHSKGNDARGRTSY